MKRIVTIALGLMMATAAGSAQQAGAPQSTPQDPAIEKALMPAPRRPIRKRATNA